MSDDVVLRFLGLAVLGVWATVVAVIDLRLRSIPNRALVAGAVLALIAGVVASGAVPADGLLDILGGGAVGLVLGMPGYLFGKQGAGDVKYAVLIGAICGLRHAVMLWIAFGVLIGLMAAGAFLTRFLFSSPIRSVPAAPALSAAFLVVLGVGVFA